MNRTLHSRRANLAAGVALLGCTLAAANRAEAQNLQYSTITSLTLSGSGTYASTPGSVTLPNTNWTGSTTYLDGTETYTNTPITSAFVTTYFTAYNDGYDFMGSYISAGVLIDWIVAGTFGVTLSQAVTVEIFNTSASWLVNGSGLTDGQALAAGTYTFDWSFTGNASFMLFGLGFHQASGGAVPLPGAAGLAACGLLAVGRRQRR
jgi:hypothetical protein